LGTGLVFLIVAQLPTGEAPATDLRLDLTELYSMDDVTNNHVAFSEVRTTIDGRREIGESTRFELHIDGRARKGWNPITDDWIQLIRGYASIGDSTGKWTFSLGRQIIDPVAAARVDGATISLRAGEGVQLLAFGGAMPNPLTFDPNLQFFIGGVGYESRSDVINHAGGAAVDIYKGGLDRAYITERAFWRPAREWITDAWVVLDMLSQRGFISEVLNTSAGTTLNKLDVTNAHLMNRWAPAREFDASVYLSHNHTILPNLWWQDYLAAERARRGFVLDDRFLPLGTRRSSGRLVLNWHIIPGITPYGAVRGDYRHEDEARGWETTLGLKLDNPDLGYLDASGSLRNYFGSRNQIGAVAVGRNFGTALGVDAAATILRVAPQGAPSDRLYDLNATLWLDMKAIYKPLGDIRLMGTYQVFIDSQMTFQVFLVRLGYRFRDV
jgi:hypothetical protein